MKAAAEYFRNIWNAISTTAAGMRITMKYWLFEPSITVEYPDRLGKGIKMEDLVSERYRGFLGLNLSGCIGCLQCMKACPIECIKIIIELRENIRFITSFDIDQAKCMYCGLCVEACPASAIVFTKRFEGACYDINDLCIRHIKEPVRVAAPKSKTDEKNSENREDK
jgi:NADH-quinone oxidoreductase subunit I/NAD(P)H-quinone oxidoreductase subunit I